MVLKKLKMSSKHYIFLCRYTPVETSFKLISFSRATFFAGLEFYMIKNYVKNHDNFIK